MTPSLSAGAVREIVHEAWQHSLRPVAFDPACSLAEMGADSLQVMGMVLRLERALGRPLPLDLLHPDATAASLVEGLCGTMAAPDTGLPLLFFLPGVGGDQPMLAAVRHALADAADFTVLPPPDAAEGTMPTMAQLANVVADAIVERQPQGPIGLAGFSFGGVLAFETARCLRDRGRAITMLLLFDPIPPASASRRAMLALAAPHIVARKLGARLKRLRTQWGHVPKGGRLVYLAYWTGAFGLTSRVARRLEATAADSFSNADRFAEWQRRADAMKTWRAAPLDVPSCLIVSEDGAFARIDRLWPRLIPGLGVLHVSGGHGGMADPAVLAAIADRLAPFIAEKMEAATG